MIDVITCTIPGCVFGNEGKPWMSPRDITTYAQRSAEVRNHIEMDHFSDFHGTRDSSMNESKVSEDKKRVPVAKYESKIDRPKFKPRVTNTEWTIFLSKWGRFLRGSGFTGEQAVEQLWECLEPEVEVALIHKGVDKLSNIEEILKKIEKKVCDRVSIVSTRLQFSNITQYKDERAEDFEGGPQGQAEICQFVVKGKCEDEDCRSNVTLSYKDEMVLHQFLRDWMDSE